MKTTVYFKTNLDEAKRYVNELNLNYRGDQYPSKGERIEFIINGIKGPGKRTFELEVMQVTYRNSGAIKEIELHIPSYFASSSINDWIKRYFRPEY